MNPIRRMQIDRSPEGGAVPPDPEFLARHATRRFTTGYKLEVLRKADACTRSGELGALLRKEGLYSSQLLELHPHLHVLLAYGAWLLDGIFRHLHYLDA